LDNNKQVSAVKATPTQMPILLVVDDDELVVDGLEATFEDDFRVLTAGSAERARELVAEHSIDIVISDDRLPQESGVSFLGWLAQEQPTAVRILLTGFFSEPGDVRRAINQGSMWHYMRKPWEAGSMENIVNRALESKQQAQAILAADVRYRSLFAAVPVPLFTADLAGKSRIWNPAFAALLQDWPGAGLSVTGRLPEGSWASLVAGLEDGVEETSQELWIRGASGQILVHLTLRRDSPDEVTGILRELRSQSSASKTGTEGAAIYRPGVLILDANDRQRRLLRRALERGAFEVLEAASLPQTLDVLSRGPVGLALLQGGRPEAGLVEVILGRYPEQAVLFCTPDVHDPAIQALATRGVSLLPMPYSLNALLDSVKGNLPD
jgi:DNA-binding response OmpR family regulator